MNVRDIVQTASVLVEFGGLRLSEPRVFPGPVGTANRWAMEGVVHMPDSYYVMLYHVPARSPRYHELGSNGLSEIRSVNVVSRDMHETDRFWQDVMGFELTVITDGVSRDWNETRAIPPAAVIRTASFHGKGAIRGPFYRVAMPGLSDTLPTLEADVTAKGFSLAGYTVANPESLLARAESAGYATIARERLDLAPWGESTITTVQAPDGLIVELGSN
jgi:hypothetical protein